MAPSTRKRSSSSRRSSRSVLGGRSSRRRGEGATHVDARAHTVVRPSATGLGLYATRTIESKSVIARMPHARVVDDPRTLAAYYASVPGSDRAIGLPDKRVVTSSGFGDFAKGRYAQAPKWYRMNHGECANTKLVEAGDLVLEWRAVRDIARGEELTWHYGKPDPAWKRKRVCPK